MGLTRLQPLSAFRPIEPIRVVFTDIDDTLTDDGRLGAAAYEALWALSEAQIAVVPVTGRPAGWCDLIARQWPVAGVVGENGALAYAATPSGMWRTTVQEARASRERLDALAQAILQEVPEARVAADQAFRQFDLAIDFAEDTPVLPRETVDRIVAVFERHGARHKVSSIHVNGWFGDHDKMSMVRRFAQERLKLELDGAHGEQAVYVGDSPNDAPAFGAFKWSVGVRNVLEDLDRMDPPPTFVTERRGGGGFVEFAEHLLAATRNFGQPGSAP